MLIDLRVADDPETGENTAATHPFRPIGGQSKDIRARRPRVLVIAYAGEPGRGSEPGAGWGIVRAVSEFADCVVLTGPEHTAGIQQWLQINEDATSFVEVPEPRGASAAKKHRTTWFLLYLWWLRRAYQLGRSLHAAAPFDAIYHATYSTYWLPTPAVRFAVPSIWGPVGGGVTTPLPLWGALGWRGIPGELLDWLAVRILALLPATRRTWRRATVRLVQNEATLSRLPESVRAKARVLNHALFTEVPAQGSSVRGRHCLLVASLERRKGVRLALLALACTPADIRLAVIGDGPDYGSLKRLACKLGVADRVEFTGKATREQVLASMSRAAAVIFTGLREEGGITLAEAMMCGAPVVVLAHGGAATIASCATDPSRVAMVPPGDLLQTARDIGSAMTRFSRHPPSAQGPTLDQRWAREELRAIFEEAVTCRGSAERLGYAPGPVSSR